MVKPAGKTRHNSPSSATNAAGTKVQVYLLTHCMALHPVREGREGREDWEDWEGWEGWEGGEGGEGGEG